MRAIHTPAPLTPWDLTLTPWDLILTPWDLILTPSYPTDDTWQVPYEAIGDEMPRASIVTDPSPPQASYHPNQYQGTDQGYANEEEVPVTRGGRRGRRKGRRDSVGAGGGRGGAGSGEWPRLGSRSSGGAEQRAW